MPADLIFQDEEMKHESTVFQFHNIYRIESLANELTMIISNMSGNRTEILQPLPMPPMLIAGFAVDVAAIPDIPDIPEVTDGMLISVVAAAATLMAVETAISMAELPWFIAMISRMCNKTRLDADC